MIGAEAEKHELVAWAARNPRIKRLWLLNERAPANGAIDVQVELQPVADSEETLGPWIAHRDEWRRQLEACTGSRVALECRDPDHVLWTREPGAGEARTLVYERAT